MMQELLQTFFDEGDYYKFFGQRTLGLYVQTLFDCI